MKITNNRLINMLSGFPADMGLRVNPKDPLNIILAGGSRYIKDVEEALDNRVNQAFIDYISPTLPTTAYYVTASFFDNETDDFDVDITETTEYAGTAQIVDNITDFMDNKITGLTKNNDGLPDEFIDLSSVLDDDDSIVGLSYGFDWDEPQWYLTKTVTDSHDMDNTIYTYNDDFSELVDTADVTTSRQDFDTTGADEYLDFVVNNMDLTFEWNDLTVEKVISLNGFIIPDVVTVKAIIDEMHYPVDFSIVNHDNGTSTMTVSVFDQDLLDEPWTDPAELRIQYQYKVADLNFTYLSDAAIIDILTIDPTTSLGWNLTPVLDIENNPDEGDYIISDSKVFLKNANLVYVIDHDEEYDSRFPNSTIENVPYLSYRWSIVSPEIEAPIGEGDKVVLDTYYKDTYNSRYIIEYNHIIDDIAGYLTPADKLNYIGNTDMPIYS